MTATPELGAVLARLRSILATGRMPIKAAMSAAILVKRLDSPVRLAVMGPPGSGKSTLCNMLVGGEVVPQDLRIPTTDIRHGPKPTLEATLPDGSRRDFPDFDFGALLACQPVLVEIRAPLPMLERISLLELVTDGSEDELAAAARWAARRADMAMWVTPEFKPLERRIWAAMPETLKHHAFLIKSLVDRHPPDQQELIRQMPTTAAGDEFQGMFPVSALQVAVALDAGVQDIDAVMEVSGCSALMDALLKRLDVGQQADMDAAEYFLSRFGDLAPPSGPGDEGRGERVQSRPLLDAPQQTRAEDYRPSSRTLSGLAGRPEDRKAKAERPAGGLSSRLPDPSGADIDPAGQGEVRPDRADPPHRTSSLLQAAALDDATPPPPSGRGLLAAALDALRDGATTMLSDLAAADDPSGDVLTRCVEAMDTLADLAQGAVDMEEIVAQATDVVLLLQMEQTETSAEDAVCALLQLKREFEEGVAA